MSNADSYLTKAKHEELTKELDDLIARRRPEIAGQLEYTRSLGDLSENAEYHQARQDQAETEGRIKHLTHLLKTAQIVELHHTDIVGVGSTVTLKRKGSDDVQTFSIVGSEEADTTLGRISLHSPLGQAVLDKKKGEHFTFLAPSGKEIEYEVVKID